MALHKTPQRYKATFTGEGSTLARTDSGAPKVEVNKGDSINVSAQIAAQYSGYNFWDVEPLANGAKDAKVADAVAKENAETRKVKDKRVEEQQAKENQPGAQASRPLQAGEEGAKVTKKESEAAEEANTAQDTIDKPNEKDPKKKAGSTHKKAESKK